MLEEGTSFQDGTMTKRNYVRKIFRLLGKRNYDICISAYSIHILNQAFEGKQGG